MGPEVMLATATSGEDPERVIARLRRQGWWFELKFDGVRAVVTRTAAGAVRVTNRHGRDTTFRFPDVVADVAALDFTGVLDGEIVVLDAASRPDFSAIHMRDAQASARSALAAAGRARAEFVPFDVLEVDGVDVRGWAYEMRRELLSKVIAPMSVSLASQDGLTMWDFVQANRLEGLIAKEPAHAYRAGRQSTWLKIKATRRLLAMVVGVQEGKGSRGAVGALVLRLWDAHARALVDLGTVGSGLSHAELRFFADWARNKPETLVVEVEFLEVGRSGKLRMPVYRGRRLEPVTMCTTDQEAYRR